MRRTPCCDASRSVEELFRHADAGEKEPPGLGAGTSATGGSLALIRRRTLHRDSGIAYGDQAL